VSGCGLRAQRVLPKKLVWQTADAAACLRAKQNVMGSHGPSPEPNQNHPGVIMAVARTPGRFGADWARSAGVAASVAPFKGRVWCSDLIEHRAYAKRSRDYPICPSRVHLISSTTSSSPHRCCPTFPVLFPWCVLERKRRAVAGGHQRRTNKCVFKKIFETKQTKIYNFETQTNKNKTHIWIVF
jgi:hypothetical protein